MDHQFPPPTKGIKNAKLTVTSDDDINPSITVSIRGEGVEQTPSDAGTDTDSI
ncbi:MAG: hypothetical protein N2746_01070 [Deltaproteobacteria bacterium]|nr:hypothetical protein [Deltaproteobacteria bacterium]